MTDHKNDDVEAKVYVYPRVLIENIANKLVAKGESMGVVESCSGGLMAEYLTRLPGSSAFFSGGLVTYATRLKVDLLSIDMAYIDKYGVVSREVVEAMATSGSRVLNTDYCIAVTGLAGPEGDANLPHLKVGTVYLACFDRKHNKLNSFKVELVGSRCHVRHEACLHILKYLNTIIS